MIRLALLLALLPLHLGLALSEPSEDAQNAPAYVWILLPPIAVEVLPNEGCASAGLRASASAVEALSQAGLTEGMTMTLIPGTGCDNGEE